MGTIFGGYKTVEASCDTTAAATEKIDMRGYAFGTVTNATAGSVTITFWSGATSYATPKALVDSSGSAVTQTVAAGKCAALASDIAGCAYLYPVVGSAADLTFHFER
jgi:hypothetical protein